MTVQRIVKTPLNCLASILIIALLAVIDAQSKPVTDNNSVITFKRNVRQNVEQMKCAKPQKRLVYLGEWLDR